MTDKKETKKPADHPNYSDMITAAIKALKERKGSSRQAIIKYITGNYNVGDNCSNYVKQALKRGVAGKKFVQLKGTGASGSFKLGESGKPAKKPVAKKPAKKPATAKKPIAKKPNTKKTAKKPTLKAKSGDKKASTGKKKTKSPPKKKPAKKTAGKKTPTKKAKKTTTKKPAKKATKGKK